MGEAAEEEEEEDSGLNSSEDSDEVEVEAQPRLPGFRGPCAGCTAVRGPGFGHVEPLLWLPALAQLRCCKAIAAEQKLTECALHA